MRVLVAEKIADAGIAMLRRDSDVDVNIGLTPEQLLDAIGDYDALIVRSATQVTAEVLERGHNLKIVGRAGVGVDNVDVEAATRLGIMVANAPTSNVVSAAEHTVALLLAQARNIPSASASMKSGRWERSKFEGVEFLGKTVGIFGLGRIGALVSQRLAGFGVKIIGYDPYVTKERAAQLGIEKFDTIDEVLERADFITVHLPKSKETIGMFGPEQFAKMKQGVRLVNTARGGIYQLDALVEALKSGKVAGASIDVWETEPTTESPLFEFPQVVATPHLGASTTEAQDKAGTMIAEQISAGLKGDFVSSAVNIALVPGEVMESLKPFLPLMEQMGRMLPQVAEGAVGEIDIEFAGAISEHDTRLLTVAFLKGMLAIQMHEPINYVNAPVLAEQRGVNVRESRTHISRDYVNLVTVTCPVVEGAGDGDVDQVLIAGTLIGKKNEPRFVKLYKFEIDIAPSRYMAFFRYVDKPGMIGKVGTALGQHDINIGSMQVGRKKFHGQALMGINVDSPIGVDVLDAVKHASGIKDAKFIEL
jgi:D-3-phosphoglycerate dehydrogenase / 2-oxoglutarate reductase